MFQEAHKKYIAGQPLSKPTKTELAKQLFPSSSPSNQRNGDISESFKKPPPSSYFGRPAASSRPAEPVYPLKNRPVNTAPPPKRAVQSTQVRKFASIVDNKGTFGEGPEVISLLNDSQTTTARSQLSSIEIDVDDFSDDEHLDLDFEPPRALPAMPPPTAKPIHEGAVSRHELAPPPTNSSVISWSSSPPTHFNPPKPQHGLASEKPVTKRGLPGDDTEALIPVAKKRGLPRDWSAKDSVKDERDEIQELYMNAVTPAPKKDRGMPWETTASGVKAQKKQLRDQQKTSAPASAELSIEEMQDIVHSRAAQKPGGGITLSLEQRHVKDLVVEKGKSVFFTGPAGTGKSVLMRAIIADLEKKHARDRERVAVTASTGLAACNIGGMTLHSFSGIGLGKEDVPTLVKKIRRNPKAKNRWLKTKVLIIDEVSMVDGDLFDKLSQIGRTLRNNGRPWGGIQLVITGDFFQLPPVPEKYDGGKGRDIKFAFEATTWATSIDHTIGLTEVFRQRDPVFANMLNEMRLGRISDDTVRNFKALQRPLRFDDDIEVTELFPTRNEVDSSNQKRLAALPGKVYKFAAMDSGEPAIRDKLLANMMASPCLELKKGAQVMLIKNMDETLVNGSLGKVVGFMSESTFELNGDGYGSEPEDSTTFKRRMKAFVNMLEASAKSKGDGLEYPLVKFRAVDGSERTLLCVPEEWKVELPTGEVQASRKQIPLIMAWALSIHKAQGQTLERVKVDLGKVFEKGQAYVALSRATTQQGLQVLRFQKDKVMAHPRVIGFYDKLYSVDSVVNKRRQTTIANFAYKPGVQSYEMDPDEESAMSAYG